MKIFFIIFILFFSSSVVADDISEFQIEGISIGDSLLDYMSEQEILNEFDQTSKHYQYLNNTTKFGEAYIFNGENFETYKNLSFFVKRNDNSYKIYLIRGMLDYVNDLNGCLKKQREISKEVEKILANYEKIERNAKSKNDPSGKSIYYYISYKRYHMSYINLRCTPIPTTTVISDITVIRTTHQHTRWVRSESQNMNMKINKTNPKINHV